MNTEKAQAAFDECKFKVGDLVRIKQDIANTTFTQEEKSSWGGKYTSFEKRAPIFQITERWLQQCHGGVQRHYHVHVFVESGTRVIDFVEPQLELYMGAEAEKQ